MTSETRPIALTIAGSDPSGGAGIQADLKTFSALGVYGASVITALTAQNTQGVSGIHAIPVDFIAAQYAAVTSDLAIGAAKTGMLGDRATVEAVARLIRRTPPPYLVVDPVMVATSGDRLLEPDAVEAVRRELIPLATLITPNLAEAAVLLGTDTAVDEAAMTAQAVALLGLGANAVLVKGGHATAADATDVLAVAGRKPVRFSQPRVATRNTHGTGCTLSAAIAAGLAMKLSLEDAVRRAKDYVSQALAAGAEQRIGAGTGPVDHLFAVQNGKLRT